MYDMDPITYTHDDLSVARKAHTHALVNAANAFTDWIIAAQHLEEVSDQTLPLWDSLDQSVRVAVLEKLFEQVFEPYRT